MKRYKNIGLMGGLMVAAVFITTAVKGGTGPVAGVANAQPAVPGQPYVMSKGYSRAVNASRLGSGAAFANRGGVAGVNASGRLAIMRSASGANLASNANALSAFGNSGVVPNDIIISGSGVISGTGIFGNGFGNGRRDRNNNNQPTVVVVDNGNGNDVNNGNYLGYPPWYRMNYYTPWMSDYENGTAYQNIPTSHAWEGYGWPGNYGTVGAFLDQQAPALAGQPQWAAATGQPQIGAARPTQPESPDFVVAVQRELRNRGFYRGVINGNSDSATRAAIRSFESSSGLPVTGIIGVPLLKALGFLQ